MLTAIGTVTSLIFTSMFAYGLSKKIAFRKVIGRIFRPKHDPSNIRDDENRWNRIPTKIQMDEVLSLQLTVEQEGPDRPGKEG